MTRVGILSDTHAYWDSRFEHYLADCNEIWHAGDFGSTEIAERLAAIAPLKGVYGNCDGGDLRRMFPEKLRWKCEEVEVLMKHIGGYPGRYDPSIRRQLIERPPQIFVSGHSHILKIMYDKNLQLLHINPGAAGLQGWQTERTLVRLTIDGHDIKDCEVVELGRNNFNLDE